MNSAINNNHTFVDSLYGITMYKGQNDHNNNKNNNITAQTTCCSIYITSSNKDRIDTGSLKQSVDNMLESV